MKLGITAIELMPVQAFFDDRYLVEKRLRTLGLQHHRLLRRGPRYTSPPAGVQDFKRMVWKLHEAEDRGDPRRRLQPHGGGEPTGPDLSFRGLDNASYYILGDDPRYYYDTTGWETP